MIYLMADFNKQDSKKKYIVSGLLGTVGLIGAGLLLNKVRVKGFIRKGKYVNSYTANRTVNNEVKQTVTKLDPFSGTKPDYYDINLDNTVVQTKNKMHDYRGYSNDKELKSVWKKITFNNFQNFKVGSIEHNGKQYKYLHAATNTGVNDEFGREIEFVITHITDKDINFSYVPKDIAKQVFDKQNFNKYMEDDILDYKPVKIKSTD